MSCFASAMCALFISLPMIGLCHFQMVIPSLDIVERPGDVNILLAFAHPFEQEGMDMARPRRMGVMARGEKADLSAALRQTSYLGHQAWSLDHAINRPGDYVFFVDPQPYWEPTEGKFIVHQTKVVVDAFGAEEGWDSPLGLEAEMMPLSRPYGLLPNQIFSAQVLFDGNPAPGIPVEVEWLNDQGIEAPAAPFVTQVVKTDPNGVFHFAMPRAGWWGFAALGEAPEAIEHDGEMRPVELGAVMWVHVAQGE